jgi:hypothetical protein
MRKTLLWKTWSHKFPTIKLDEKWIWVLLSILSLSEDWYLATQSLSSRQTKISWKIEDNKSDSQIFREVPPFVVMFWLDPDDDMIILLRWENSSWFHLSMENTRNWESKHNLFNFVVFKYTGSWTRICWIWKCLIKLIPNKICNKMNWRNVSTFNEINHHFELIQIQKVNYSSNLKIFNKIVLLFDIRERQRCKSHWTSRKAKLFLSSSRLYVSVHVVIFFLIIDQYRIKMNLFYFILSLSSANQKSIMCCLTLESEKEFVSEKINMIDVVNW